jgi:hypothetical protein
METAEAYDGQWKKELNDETRILIKEAELLLNEIKEFRVQQNEAATIIKETRQNNLEMKMFFKAITYLFLSEDAFVKNIEDVAKENRDKDFLNWFLFFKKEKL